MWVMGFGRFLGIFQEHEKQTPVPETMDAPDLSSIRRLSTNHFYCALFQTLHGNLRLTEFVSSKYEFARPTAGPCSQDGIAGPLPPEKSLVQENTYAQSITEDLHLL